MSINQVQIIFESIFAFSFICIKYKRFETFKIYPFLLPQGYNNLAGMA